MHCARLAEQIELFLREKGERKREKSYTCIGGCMYRAVAGARVSRLLYENFREPAFVTGR